MDGFSGTIIWIILGIIISIVSKAKKDAAKQQQQNSSNNAAQGSTLQSQLKNAMNQINEIKNMATDQTRFQQNTSSAGIQTNKSYPYANSLEGQVVEGTKVEGFQMEGAKVEGFQMEGQKVEGLAQKHSTKKFRENTVAVTESSMGAGYDGEGCDTHYDMELMFLWDIRQDTQILQGIIMSQVLERPKRRY